MAAPSPAEIQYQLQHIHDDRSNGIITSFGVCLGVATITVLLRFVARRIKRAPLAGDDWTIVAGLLCAIGYVAGQAVCVSHGLGRHQVLVTEPVPLARALTASIMFYITSLSFTKISILLLYRRIFPNRKFHAIILAVGTFVTVFTISNVLFIIFRCNPIKAGFEPFTKAKCIVGGTSILAVAIITTATDFVILLLPLPLVWKLQLPNTRKFQLTLIFLLGIFTSVASIYRATQITNVSNADLSYDSTNRAIWSGVEICAAIVCANLAILRPILKYLSTHNYFPVARLGTSRATSSGTGKGWRHRWAWRNVAPVTSEASNDDRFHRLEHHPGALSSDDIERQKYEGYTMSPLTAPVNSPRMPEATHF